jgi:hypothetical protein
VTGFVVVEAPAFQVDLEELERSNRGIRDDVSKLVRRIESDPNLPGDVIPGAGGETRKVRLPVKAMRRGSRGGARVIIQAYRDLKTVALLAIYLKSDRDDISKTEIQRARRDCARATPARPSGARDNE